MAKEVKPQERVMFCPILSAASMMRPGSGLVAADGKSTQIGIACVKAQCGFWHQIAVNTGTEVAIIEGCAIPHIADGLMAVQQSIHTVAEGVEIAPESAPAKEKVQ